LLRTYGRMTMPQPGEKPQPFIGLRLFCFIKALRFKPEFTPDLWSYDRAQPPDKAVE